VAELERPIADSYWVRPGKFLAGEYPGALDDQAARRRLRRLVQVGIRVFLDLTEEGERTLQGVPVRPYAGLLIEEAAALGTRVEHIRMPIRDLTAPPAEAMSRILDRIDGALDAGLGVYVHCFGGIGRTGTVVGCYLIRHGMSGEEALATIARWRAGTPDGERPSPETAEQVRMVRAWPAGR
jgi:hypothetical protein